MERKNSVVVEQERAEQELACIPGGRGRLADRTRPWGQLDREIERDRIERDKDR